MNIGKSSLIIALCGACLTIAAAAPADAQLDRSGLVDEFDNPIPNEDYFRTTRAYYGGLAPGAGREETFYAFEGCMKIEWITKQRLSREQWEATVRDLIAECDVTSMDAGEKQLIVNYLTRYYGP